MSLPVLQTRTNPYESVGGMTASVLTEIREVRAIAVSRQPFWDKWRVQVARGALRVGTATALRPFRQLASPQPSVTSSSASSCMKLPTTATVYY